MNFIVLVMCTAAFLCLAGLEIFSLVECLILKCYLHEFSPFPSACQSLSSFARLSIIPLGGHRVNPVKKC